MCRMPPQPSVPTIDRLQPTDVVFIADENTARHCLPRLGDRLDGRLVLTMAPGEPNKTLATCHTVWSGLLRHGLDRHGLIVNVGGGVVTDLGGFCAATWKRGVRFVQIPTSLLAMVDAAVGGKTGVDFHGAKNQVGVFADPAGVLIDPGFSRDPAAASSHRRPGRDDQARSDRRFSPPR